MTTAIRLQRFLSQAGVAARRKAEILIERGLVTVNGKVVTRMGVKVVPGVDRVCVEGKAVYPQDPFYVLLNKPKGCITAVSDDRGRLTVMDYLRNVPVSLAPVGRLDFYSEGVLLLTNDGELTARLLSPAYRMEKTYHVKVRGRVTDAQIQSMREGVRLDPRTRTRPAQVDRLRTPSRHDWLVITLTEGKSRQIHRMLEVLGHTVLKLQRVAFAGLTFHGLRVGDARELSQAEVNALRGSVDLPRNTVSRGKWKCAREDTELSRRARLRRQARNDAEQRGDRAKRGDRTDARSRPRDPAGSRERTRASGRPSSERRGRSGPAQRSPGEQKKRRGDRTPGSNRTSHPTGSRRARGRPSRSSPSPRSGSGRKRRS